MIFILLPLDLPVPLIFLSHADLLAIACFDSLSWLSLISLGFIPTNNVLVRFIQFNDG